MVALLVLVLVLGLASGCSGPAPGPPPTRLLLLTVDTLRSDHVGRTVHGVPLTPFLDRLIAEGAHFPHTIAPVPRTTQSLASLLTGAYPHGTGVRTLYDALRADVVPLAEILAARGWTCWAVVSNHVLVPERRLDRGFAVYDHASDARDAGATGRAVLRHLAERGPPPADRPFFLWVHVIDPHVPYLPPVELARALDPGYEGRYRDGFGSEPGGIGDRAYPPDLPKEVAVYRNPLPERVVEHVRRLYAAEVRATDDRLAELVAALREAAGSDWAIVFAADHGEELGEHGIHWDHGDTVYQPGLEVPLAFVLPPDHPLRRGRVVTTPVSLVDVLPTVLDLLGIDHGAVPAGQLEGRSLVPALRGEELPPRPVFAESGRSFFPHLVPRRVDPGLAGRFRAVVDGRSKLIRTRGQRPDLEWELYDLAADPGERRDLAAADVATRERLAGVLAEWMRRDPGAEEREPSAADRERLRSLGYLE